MKDLTIGLAPVLLWAMLCSPAAFAQAEQTPERIPGAEDLAAEDAEDAEDAEKESASAAAEESREVDFNEENFRRSMELRDEALQRSPDLTTGSYSRGTGVQALDSLPEASQKHLREQLREVIVEHGPWTPGEAGEVYPYVPSAEAMENGTLKKRELAAWSELVAKYHEREAAMHANAARSQAATGEDTGEGPPAGAPGTEKGSETEAGENSEKAQRAEALAELLESDGSAGSGQPTGAAPAAEQGVSQSALELLTQRQQLPASSTAPQAKEGQAESEESEESELELDSEGVIAIEDLEKVRLDPEAAEKD